MELKKCVKRNNSRRCRYFDGDWKGLSTRQLKSLKWLIPLYLSTNLKTQD